MASLQLKKFNMDMLSDDSVVVAIGKRRTGKSVLVKDILYHKKSIPIGNVISATEQANSFFSYMIPSIFIHDDWDPSIVENLLKRQKLVIRKMKRELSHKGSTNIDPRAFLILDDCLYDKTWSKAKCIRACFMNGRHYKLLFIITMQYALGVPPHLRTNIDFIFIFRETYISNRKRLYDHYCGMFPNLDTFCQVMDQCTENFECLVINNNANSNKLTDQVFWYKAKLHKNSFKVGAPCFWKHHKQNFLHSDDEEEEDKEQFTKVTRKKHPIIHVKKSY